MIFWSADCCFLLDGAGMSGLELGPTDWPDGCINYAINLVRPVQQGHRKKVLYHLLSNGLVFEDLESAGRYREFVTQVCGFALTPTVYTVKRLMCHLNVNILRCTLSMS